MWRKKEGWLVSWRSFVSLRWKGGIPRLVLHEKYEDWVKWSLRGVTAAGLVLCFVNLPPLVSFLVAVGSLAVEQLLERAIIQWC